MGEVVSGLRFRKNHIVPQPTHPRDLHGPRGSSDPTGGDPHPDPGGRSLRTLYRLCDHPDPTGVRPPPRTILELRDHQDPGGRSLRTLYRLHDHPDLRGLHDQRGSPDPTGGVLTPDYVNDSIIYMYIQ